MQREWGARRVEEGKGWRFGVLDGDKGGREKFIGRCWKEDMQPKRSPCVAARLRTHSCQIRCRVERRQGCAATAPPEESYVINITGATV